MNDCDRYWRRKYWHVRVSLSSKADHVVSNRLELLLGRGHKGNGCLAVYFTVLWLIIRKKVIPYLCIWLYLTPFPLLRLSEKRG